jgi:hypothetical protein
MQNYTTIYNNEKRLVFSDCSPMTFPASSVFGSSQAKTPSEKGKTEEIPCSEELSRVGAQGADHLPYV